MPEIIIWFNLGLTALALVLLVVLLIRRPKTNVREFLLETRLDINESLNNSIDNLGKVISQTQKDNSDLLLKSINSFFQQGSDRDTKFAMETEQKLENIRKNLDSSLNGIRDTPRNHSPACKTRTRKSSTKSAIWSTRNSKKRSRTGLPNPSGS